MKKYFESPWIPIVPGPTISAKTLTSEKAPLIIPKPRPDTGRNNTQKLHPALTITENDKMPIRHTCTFKGQINLLTVSTAREVRYW